MGTLRSVSAVDIQPVGPGQLDALAALFTAERATRHCWCTAFCATRWQFATGWYGGGNRRRFETMAATERAPMGVLAAEAGEPIGWCACGPMIRYTAAIDDRNRLLADRPRVDEVWLIACLYLAPQHRGSWTAVALIRAAVSLARAEGASAVEAWPLAAGVRRRGEEHVGREGVFARLGFNTVQRPSLERVVMRLDLGAAAGQESDP